MRVSPPCAPSRSLAHHHTRQYQTHNFTRLGGVITLELDESKVRFEVNLQSAERARLKVSSKLLTLARVVRSEAKN